MILLVRDTINKVVLPSLFCTSDGTHVVDLSFTNENMLKEFSVIAKAYQGRLMFEIEHTCENIASTDEKINFDVGSFPLSISENNNLLINTFIKIQ